MNTALLANANLFEISPFNVDEGERIGFLHEDKAAALGRLMAVDGQRDPIKVVANPGNDAKPWRLVTGMHRLIGARLESLTIYAIEVSGKPEDLADLEASENLHRRPLAQIERAKFVQALCEAAQVRIARQHGELRQHQLAVKARWARVKDGEVRSDDALREEADDTADKMSAVYGWVDSAADAFGLDKRTIRRSLELYRLIVEPFPGLVEQLAAHPVVGENAAQLKLIADVRDEQHRREIIARIIADPELSADAARVQAGIDQAQRAPTTFEKFTNQISGGLARLSATEQKRGLPSIVNALKSDEVKRQLRDLLTEELGHAG